MKRIVFLIISFIVFLTLSLLLFIQNKKEEKDEFTCPFSFCKNKLWDEYKSYQNKTNLSLKDTILRVNIGLNHPFYTNVKESPNKDTTKVLVNKYNYLPKDYVPSNLVNTEKYSKNVVKINATAYGAFIKMAEDIEKENMHIRIISAYRSYDYQNNLYNNYLKYEPQYKVDTYSSRPGFSEHQTGLTIDIDNKIVDYNRFDITQEFKWMQENAFKYGFILRYPLNKEDITGYTYEPWHYRYVGKTIAKYIYEHNITYEEYYYEFIDIKS